MKKVLALAAFGLLGVTAVVAYAHGGPEDRTERRQAFHEKMLEKFDTNKDGTLSEEERTAAHAQMAQQRFQTLDTNKDGVLSFDEFKAGAGMHRGGFGRHHRGDGGGRGGEGSGDR